MVDMTRPPRRTDTDRPTPIFDFEAAALELVKRVGVSPIAQQSLDVFAWDYFVEKAARRSSVAPVDAHESLLHVAGMLGLNPMQVNVAYAYSQLWNKRAK